MPTLQAGHLSFHFMNDEWHSIFVNSVITVPNISLVGKIFHCLVRTCTSKYGYLELNSVAWWPSLVSRLTTQPPQTLLEGGSELFELDRVDEWVDGRVGVAKPEHEPRPVLGERDLNRDKIFLNINKIFSKLAATGCHNVLKLIDEYRQTWPAIDRIAELNMIIVEYSGHILHILQEMMSANVCYLSNKWQDVGEEERKPANKENN